jgi:formate hydrogenlyase subunit 3/multisubunit Na+/H+ antiporter MnhD subunit
MTELLPLAVLAPLALGVTAFVVPERAARALVAPGCVAVTAIVAAVALNGQWPQRYAFGGWPEPLGIALHADALAVGLLPLTCAVYAAVLAFATAYFPRGARESALFWPLAWLLWAALNAAFLSADLFNLYVTLELLGLSAVGLAALSGKPAALAAALRYLIAALVGSNLFLLAVALVYGATGVLALDALAARLDDAPYTALAIGLAVTALVLKTALAPLHFWLPPAHGGASTPVSALLSALVIKASFLIVLRLWLLAAPRVDLVALGQLLAWLGAAAIVWGSAQALVQSRLKMLVAYSTVAQVGYLFVPFAWLSPGQPAAALALEAGVLQVLAHGVAKAAMFLAAGTLVLAAGRDDLSALRGAAARAPLAIFAFGLAGASLIGLPPTVGFAAKWQLLQAAAASGQWPWVAVVVAGGLLAAAYIFRVLKLAFLPAPEATDAAPVAGTLSLAALLLALVAAVGSLFAEPLLDALQIGALAWGRRD